MRIMPLELVFWSTDSTVKKGEKGTRDRTNLYEKAKGFYYLTPCLFFFFLFKKKFQYNLFYFILTN